MNFLSEEINLKIEITLIFYIYSFVAFWLVILPFEKTEIY